MKITLDAAKIIGFNDFHVADSAIFNTPVFISGCEDLPRIIKANQVNITDGFLITVPDKSMISPDDYSDEPSEEEVGEELSYEETIENANRQAEQLLEEAKEAAAQIVEEARAQAEQEREAIFEEARQEGYNNGYNEAKKEGERIIAEAEKTLKDALEEKERILREAEPEAVEVVIEVIEKLAGDIVKLNPGVILNLIKAGIEGAPGAKQLFVRVSDDDYKTAADMLEEIEASVDSDTQITLIKDTSLKQGGCVIDTPIGSVDSSLGTQLNGIKSDLIQILKMWS